MSVRNYINSSPQVTTTGVLSSSSTSVTVTTLAGFPATTPWAGVLGLGTGSEEAVLVTAITGSTMTVSRGYDGTAAVSHSAGETFDHVMLALDLREANAHVNADDGVHGVTGDVVGTTDTQTVSGKTLQSSKSLASGGVPGVVFQSASGSPSIVAQNDSGTTTFQVAGAGDISAHSLTATNVDLTGHVTAEQLTLSGGATVASDLEVVGKILAQRFVMDLLLTNEASRDSTFPSPDSGQIVALLNPTTHVPGVPRLEFYDGTAAAWRPVGQTATVLGGAGLVDGASSALTTVSGGLVGVTFSQPFTSAPIVVASAGDNAANYTATPLQIGLGTTGCNIAIQGPSGPFASGRPVRVNWIAFGS